MAYLAEGDCRTRKLLVVVTILDNEDVTFSCNQQGQRTTATDQRGCVHSHDHDKLGWQTQDRITTLGSGVDEDRSKPG